MYKLLIVEDEKWEREGLVDFLDWSAFDIEIVGTAVNGVQGLKLSREYLPDIIITDIKMPAMDGLLLSRKVKQLLPDCKIIILTGYDDFEYARDAIKYGVCQYLLKPVHKDQLLDVINKMKKDLFQESKRTEHMHVLKNQLAESEDEKRERFLLSVLGGNLHYLKNMAWFNTCFCKQDFVAVVFRFDVYSFCTDNKNCNTLVHFREYYKQIRRVVGNDGIAAQDDTGNCEIIICLPAGGREKKYITDFVRRIRGENYGGGIPKCIIGIGTVTNTLEEFTRSFIQAKAALDRLFFMKDSELLFFNDIICLEEHGANEFFISAAAYSKKVLNAVVSSDLQEVIALSDELFEYIYSNPVEKNLVFNYFVNMISDLSVLLKNIDKSLEPAGMISEEILDEMRRFLKLEDLKTWFRELLIYANNCFYDNKNNREKNLVGKVMDIIKNEYNCNIGVETVACRLELSPNYLGSLFKRYTGKRFTEALTEQRMKKAEELLISRTGNVMDIAKSVGYDNASYFCTVFKKTYGISPMDYQERYSYENM